jgi:hypothetical protein
MKGCSPWTAKDAANPHENESVRFNGLGDSAYWCRMVDLAFAGAFLGADRLGTVPCHLHWTCSRPVQQISASADLPRALALCLVVSVAEHRAGRPLQATGPETSGARPGYGLEHSSAGVTSTAERTRAPLSVLIHQEAHVATIATDLERGDWQVQ